MRTRTIGFGIGLVAAAIALMQPAMAQTRYPTRPVTLVVPFAPGGSGDVTIRYIADQLQKSKSTAMVVENRPGGGATIGMSFLARSAPDGYTVGLISTSPFTVTPYFQKVPYDPIKDFTFLAQYTIQPAPIYVTTESRFKTIEDLIEFGRANPGKIRWTTAAARGTNHIAIEAALRQSNVRATFVTFGGGAEGLTSLLGGNLEFAAGTDFGPPLKNKQIRLLAETGPMKIAGHPEVKTFSELGYPLILPIFLGLGGPAGLSAEAVKFWEDSMREMAGSPPFIEMLAKYFSQPEFLDGKAFAQRIRDAHASTGKAVVELGMIPK